MKDSLAMLANTGYGARDGDGDGSFNDEGDMVMDSGEVDGDGPDEETKRRSYSVCHQLLRIPWLMDHQQPKIVPNHLWFEYLQKHLEDNAVISRACFEWSYMRH